MQTGKCLVQYMADHRATPRFLQGAGVEPRSVGSQRGGVAQREEWRLSLRARTGF